MYSKGLNWKKYIHEIKLHPKCFLNQKFSSCVYFNEILVWQRGCIPLLTWKYLIFLGKLSDIEIDVGAIHFFDVSNFS